MKKECYIHELAKRSALLGRSWSMADWYKAKNSNLCLGKSCDECKDRYKNLIE